MALPGMERAARPGVPEHERPWPHPCSGGRKPGSRTYPLTPSLEGRGAAGRRSYPWVLATISPMKEAMKRMLPMVVL